MASRHAPFGNIVRKLIRQSLPMLAAACALFLPAKAELCAEESLDLEILIPKEAIQQYTPLEIAQFRLREFILLLSETPEFVDLLNDANAEAISASMQYLAAIGPEARPAAGHVKEIALSPTLNDNLRFQAAFAMLSITPEDEAVVGEILAAPNTPLADGEAYFALGFFLANAMYDTGHTAAEVPGLCKVAEGDYDKQARLVALSTLENLGQEAAAALPTLWSLLQDDDEMVKACAGSAILGIEVHVNAELARLLADRLEWTGEKRKQLVEAVNETAAMREKECDDLRRWAEDVVPECVAMLRHGREAHRRTAMRRLAQIGTAGRAAVPSLMDCAANAKEPATRSLARSTLMQIAPDIDAPPE